MTTAFGTKRHGGRLAAALALFSLGCITGESTHNPGGTGGGSGAGGSSAGAGGGGAGGGGGGGAGGAITGSGGAGAGTGSGGGGAGGGGGTGQTPLPLPVAVTTVFNNQGWFGDAAVAAFFATGSTIIRQGESTTGPCAARVAGARGSCLQVVYTPPSALAQADGGAGSYVGVFMLTTLMMAHPELTPPGFIGDANWGAEPGRLIAPGATRISFSAASATAGLTVAFRAGTATDPFTLPEQNETLTTGWTSYDLSLAGITYSTPILGGFAWVLHDTSKPATFYIDGIVWE